MFKGFTILSRVLAVLVLVQAGLSGYSAFGAGDSVAGSLHSKIGMMVIPVIALAILVLGVLSKMPGALKMGAVIVVMIIVQIGLGEMGWSAPILGSLHAVTGLLIFAAAGMAPVIAQKSSTESPTPA